MALKSVLKEKAMWRSVTGRDEYGKTTYVEKEINCMIEEKIKLVSNDKGEKIVNYSSILTNEMVKIGDSINSRPVASANLIKNGRGKIQGVEVIIQ